MSDKSDVSAVGLVAQVSSNISGPCVECGINLNAIDNWAGAVNHYLAAHGYLLTHVGQQTSRDDHGDLWHFTVAVLGKER